MEKEGRKEKAKKHEQLGIVGGRKEREKGERNPVGGPHRTFKGYYICFFSNSNPHQKRRNTKKLHSDAF